MGRRGWWRVVGALVLPAGEVPAAGGAGICDGAGQCAQGQAFTFLEGSVSRACQSPGGSLELACNVFCTRCR